MPDLGDQTPLELMDKMLALLGNHPPCFLFRRIFLRHMPDDIWHTLVHSKVEDVRQLAEEADRLWHSHSSQASALCHAKPTSNKEPRDQKLADPDLCHYHNKFGVAARNCRPPCKLSPKSVGNKQATCQ